MCAPMHGVQARNYFLRAGQGVSAMDNMDPLAQADM